MNERGDERTRNICPYLGTMDEEGKPAPYIDYPSFENNCFVGIRPEAIMLTDQATFCLSSGHRHCPRLTTELDASSSRSDRSAAGAAADGFASASPSDPLLNALADMEEAMETRRIASRRRKRRMSWIGIIAAFLSTVACGGLFAAYIGWELVNRDGIASTAGSVTTIAQPAPTLAAPPLYLVVTATSDAVQASAQSELTVATSGPALPQAVTATPRPAGQSAFTTIGGRVSAPEQGANAGAVDASEPRPTPVLNMLVQVPTRRPTPVLDLAITVPTVPLATPFQSPTPIPPAGTPVVIFAAEDEELESGECTTVSWHVENVSAVYYENLGVDGHGEAEECIRDKPGDYVLTIVLPNGGTDYYTVTVGLIQPTATPTPTSTRPPYVEPTATWTPDVPTATPTPDMQYGVRLTVEDGSEHACPAGGDCTIELRLTNTSLGIDDISVLFLQSGSWDASLCRLDGVCSDSKLTLASVGPSNTALIVMEVDVPETASGRSETYTLRAVSEGSGGEDGSDAVSITVTAQ